MSLQNYDLMYCYLLDWFIDLLSVSIREEFGYNTLFVLQKYFGFSLLKEHFLFSVFVSFSCVVL